MKLKENNRSNTLDIIALLQQQGVTQAIAEYLVLKYPARRICFQIKMLPFRNPKNNPAGLLVKAIRENWAPPTKYVEHQKVEAAYEAEQQNRIEEMQRKRVERKQIQDIKAHLSRDELKALEAEAKQKVARVIREKYGDNLPPILVDSIMNQLIRVKYLENKSGEETSHKT